MTRRSLFATLAGSTAAITAPAAAGVPRRAVPGLPSAGEILCLGGQVGTPARWLVEWFNFGYTVDCEMGGCRSQVDFSAKYVVTDRSTAVQRFACQPCAEEFRRNPVPLFLPYSFRFGE